MGPRRALAASFAAASLAASLSLLGAACDAPGTAPAKRAAIVPLPVASPPSPPAAPPLAAPTAAPSAGPAVDARAAAPASIPAQVEPLQIPGQTAQSVVRGADGKPPRIVFLPGICSNAYAYLLGFADAARDHGGAIAIDGDRACGATPGFRSITSDPAHEEPRIDAALVAAGVASPATTDIVYVGYSLGATLIENLVRKSPERYRRVVLIGSPRDPRLDRLKGAQAVATVSCALDVPWRMKAATTMLERAGIASKYFEMPGCTHGNLTEGDRTFGEIFGWLEGAPLARAGSGSMAAGTR